MISSQVEHCAALSERLDLFQVLLDYPDALEELKKRPLKDGRQWHVWLKLDCGNGRGRARGHRNSSSRVLADPLFVLLQLESCIQTPGRSNLLWPSLRRTAWSSRACMLTVATPTSAKEWSRYRRLPRKPPT